MQKTRKTRKQKVATTQRKERIEGFSIKKEWLASTTKKPVHKAELGSEDKKYFKQDLTKTLILTMLVVAVELALWHYLSRQ